MTKKFAFILPYIGKLPDWFQLWLNSCARNELVDWLLFTDDHRPFIYPKNVIVHYCSFDELRHLFQKPFDFHISISHPYRFCDFKPSYGVVFRDFLAGYDYWGHCDPDLIWGDLNKWLSVDGISKYNRISHWGHCSLYKNCEEMNSLFKNRIEGIAFYKDVYSNNRHIAFDEEYGMNIITREKGIKEYVIPFFDVKPAIQSYGFTPTFVAEPFFPDVFKNKLVQVSQDGVIVYGLDSSGNLINRDFAYVHLQKRRMNIKINMMSDSYLIVPNSFIPNKGVDKDLIKKLTPGFLNDYAHRKFLVWKSRYNMIKKAF